MYPNSLQPQLSDEAYEDGLTDPMIAPPDWRALITESMDANCLAPSDEALGLAFEVQRYIVDWVQTFIRADDISGLVSELLDEVLNEETMATRLAFRPILNQLN